MRFSLCALSSRSCSCAVTGAVMAVQGPPADPAPIPPPPDVAAPPKDATTLPSGLASKVLQPGTGTAKPAADRHRSPCITRAGPPTGRCSTARVARNAPNTFPLDRVIKGWGEGVQLMIAGEKRRLWIPQTLAYKGQAGRPAGMLVFDIELLELRAAAHRAAARRRGGRPPTRSARRPAWPTRCSRPAPAPSIRGREPRHRALLRLADQRQAVRQLGDARRARHFGLGDVIPGWTEGVQLMVVGEKTRFWIPEGLAYKGQSGVPRGMLVFDVELIAIAI